MYGDVINVVNGEILNVTCYVFCLTQLVLSNRLHLHLCVVLVMRALELKPLKLRFLKFDLIQYYEILNNLTCLVYT